MKTEKELKNIGRYLSMLLRHQPEKENLNMDTEGYVKVSEILNKLDLSKENLDWIVENNDKKRFAYNTDESLIRASQGHSINIDLKLKKILPPPILYHGTTIDNLKKIQKDGLKKIGRNHVHLTYNYMTAFDVGLRYAKYQNKILIFEIDSRKMNEDGHEFYISDNNVHLVEHVPPEYLKIILPAEK